MKDNTEGSRQMKKTGGTDNVPYKFLARLDNRMPLRYRKLWFQLTCPQGRIRIIVHSNTEDAASCTAEVYLNKKDSNPVSACTAACSRKEAENFLKAAENCALTGALIQAGFTRPERLTPVPTRKKPPQPEPVSPVGNQLPDRQPQLTSKKEGNSQNQEKPIHRERICPISRLRPLLQQKRHFRMQLSFRQLSLLIRFPSLFPGKYQRLHSLPGKSQSRRKPARQRASGQQPLFLPAQAGSGNRKHLYHRPLPKSRKFLSPLPGKSHTQVPPR